jgi:uncharacterized repeat protein (TIGR01451 family)
MCERNSILKAPIGRSLSFVWQRIGSLWLAVLMGLTGCQTLSLPRIDPSGNRIFTGGATTLINPHDPNNGYPSTAPAFQDPPDPPKCLGGEKCKGCLGCRGKLGAKAREEDERGRCGELLLTPTRIVAPVDGEVILLAGVCGKDGLLVTNEKIEWMLSPESVGQFVEVGDDAKGQRPSFWKKSNDPKVEKLGIDYARGRTSKEPSVITKGTSNPSDDLPLRKGQTWISLTSPAEGTSKVTVLAPDSDVWDKRRQTATIYWVDASWDIPQPIVVVDNAPAILVTKVMRSDGLVPAEGWIVRYRSLNPDFAQFETPMGYLPETEVKVDKDGLAGAKLLRGQNMAEAANLPRNGMALVEVEIERPAFGDMPRVPLARRTTSVTWSAPNLVLDVFGPEVASPGQNLQYLIRVSNTGDLPAENVEVIAAFPAGLRVDFSYRPRQETNGAAIWNNFGPIAPRSAFEVIANVTPTTDLQGRVQVDARIAGAPQVQTKTVPLVVQSPKVTLQFSARGNIAQAPLNGLVTFDGLLVNTGNQTINDLRVQIESDGGMVHEQSGAPSVSNSYPVIRPGERIPFEVVYRVVREGDSRIVASASLMGQTIASQALGMRGLGTGMPTNPPGSGAVGGVGGGGLGGAGGGLGVGGGRPAIQLRLIPQPDQRRVGVGSTVALKCVVSNTGTGDLRQPELAILYDPSLQVQYLDPNTTDHIVDQRLIRWKIRDMISQQALEFVATFVARTPNAQAIVQVEASSADGLRDTKQVAFEIVGGGGQTGAGQPGGSVLPPINPPPGTSLPGTSLPGSSLPGSSLPGSSLPGTSLPGTSLPSAAPPENSVLPNNSGLPGSGLPSGLPSTSGPGSMRPELGSTALSSDRLAVSIQPMVDVVRRGDTVTYEVRVENLVSQPDQKVGLQLTIPRGAKLVAVKALALDYKSSEDGRLIEFTPIQFFRAKDSFTYLIQLKHEESGQQTITAAARSLGQPAPVSTKHIAIVQ